MKIPSLRELFRDYKTSLELLKEDTSEKIRSLAIEEGKVYKLKKEGAPCWVLVVEKEKGYCLVSPMTFMWELATKYDVLVEFLHPLRDIWIVELDLSTDVPEETLRGAVCEGAINKEDFELVRKILKEDIPIPKNKKGIGYNDRVHKEFKSFELDRHRWLYESFFSSLTDEKYAEEDTYFQLLELSRELPAASSDKNVVELPFGEVVIDRENRRALVVFKEELKGKKGELSVEFDGNKVSLFRGELHDLELKNLDEEIFKLFEYLKLEIEDEGNS